MKKFLLYILILCNTTLPVGIFSPNKDVTNMQEDAFPIISKNNDDLASTNNQPLEEEFFVSFSYNNVSLITIINQLAEYKGYNIIFPQGQNAINANVTFSLKEPVLLDKAWDNLISILDLAGYSIKYQGSTITIIKNTKDISRETFETFIGTEPNNLPQSNTIIRYVYYLSNIKVTDKTGDGDLQSLFKSVMPADALFNIDIITNALILVGKSDDIKGFMEIVLELDKVTFEEKIEIIKLQYINATTATQLITENLIKQDTTNRYRLDAKRQPDSTYINPFTKVVAVPRTNSIILLGNEQSIERLRNFIVSSLDIDLAAPNEHAKPILHIYELQYRNAEVFSEVLRKIIDSSKQGGTEQSKAKIAGSAEYTFGEVIITTDKPKNAEELQYYGANKLIIMCSNKDYEQIEKKIIQPLDTPDDIFFIEILVADLLFGDSRALSSQFRIPAKFSLPGTMEAQTSHLDTTSGAPAIVADLNADGQPISINSDLLRELNTDAATPQSLATFTPVGSTLITINDSNGKTSSILSILDNFSHAKVLSHPSFTCTNNQKTVIASGEQRLLRDDTTAGTGAPVTRFKEINAELKVELTGRIVGNSLFLQFKISINDFAGENNTQTIRYFESSVVIPSGGILVCGGLSRTQNSENKTETPILSRIPIIGPLFFTKKHVDFEKNTLAVFISPTILTNRFQQGELNEPTKDYIDITKQFAHDHLFDSLKDPISRWFFPKKSSAESKINNFLAESKQKPQDDTLIEKTTTDKENSSKNVTMEPEQSTIHEQKSDNLPIDSDVGLFDVTTLKEKLQNTTNPFRK